MYFTYNKAGAVGQNPNQRQSAVTLARGRFDGKALTNVEELFTGDWNNGASGSRLAFGRDGSIYMTTGAPFDEKAQRTDTVYGKVLRLTEDGKVPPDNPFVGRSGARPEVFSMGHRDQLGLTVHEATGTVLAAEHGPNGGDEVNVILPGTNYGWPTLQLRPDLRGSADLRDAARARTSSSRSCCGSRRSRPRASRSTRAIAIPAWKGNLFVGSARRGEVPRTGGLERVVVNDKLEELRRESLLTELHQRIRDVRQGPDGLLYVITDEDDGALLRIEPAQ